VWWCAVKPVDQNRPLSVFIAEAGDYRPAAKKHKMRIDYALVDRIDRIDDRTNANTDDSNQTSLRMPKCSEARSV